MKIFLLHTLLFSFCCFTEMNNICAQIKKPGIHAGVYGIFAKPQGSFANVYNFGGGVEGFGGVGWGNTFIVASAALSAFSAKSSSYGTLTYVPVKAGFKQFFLKKHLFVNADMGAAAVKNKLVNEPRFIRGIGAGIKLPGVEAAIYYGGWKNKGASGFSNSVEIKFGWSVLL
jgi:hypothetical protein